MTKLTINPFRNKKFIYPIHIINIIKTILLILTNYKIKIMKLALENKRKKRKFTLELSTQNKFKISRHKKIKIKYINKFELMKVLN